MNVPAALTPDQRQVYETSRRATLLALEKIDESTLLELTRLTLPEIRALRQEIAQVLPVGNLPAFILGGLVKLKGRKVNTDQVKRDLSNLFQGINIMPKGLYGAFIAGPATVLHAYQKLLQLAGKDADAAFPEGTWQFYLQFGLREDTARHANETVGFGHAFSRADPLSAATAWMWAIADFVLAYDDLLAVDWRERVKLRLLYEVAEEIERHQEPVFIRLSRDWNAQRPYTCPDDGSPYLPHRRAQFDAFFNQRLARLPEAAQKTFRSRYRERSEAELRAYQEQMTLLCALKPERYQEQREPVPVWRAQVGFVWGGQIYLMPLCQRDDQGRLLCHLDLKNKTATVPLQPGEGDTLRDAKGRAVVVAQNGQVWDKGRKKLLGRLRPPTPAQVKGWIAAIVDDVPAPDAADTLPLDLLLAQAPRPQQGELRAVLPPETQTEIERLRHAPVILNWDPRPAGERLSHLRRGQRGIGDHALTVFRTERSFVFDQSHIFFDGLWGMAVAERLTNKAIEQYPRVVDVPPVAPNQAPRPLQLSAPPQAIRGIQKLCQPGEAAAEDDGIQVRRLNRLRSWLAQRGVRLTVNDLLLLYRYVHAGVYKPSPAVRRAIDELGNSRDKADQAAARAVDECLAQMKDTNPALLIPMDASNVAPRERVFPTTFRNPLVEISAEISAAVRAYQTYKKKPTPDTWQAFDAARREMLAYFKAFGEVLDALKAVTMRGESFNTATIRMLAHLPASMQNLLDQIPQRIGVLNEIIKGNEVFSNVGRVAPGSSLHRFTSARDDGHTKQLVWGVLTDDDGVMRVSLRDFRPFVPLLLQLENLQGRALADALARDYLQNYVKGFNGFVAALGEMVAETKPGK